MFGFRADASDQGGLTGKGSDILQKRGRDPTNLHGSDRIRNYEEISFSRGKVRRQPHEEECLMGIKFRWELKLWVGPEIPLQPITGATSRTSRGDRLDTFGMGFPLKVFLSTAGKEMGQEISYS